MKEVIIIGASGHAKVCLDILQIQGRKVVGFCDDNPRLIGQKIHGIEVIGSISSFLPEMHNYDIFIGIGDNNDRKNIVKFLKENMIESNINAIHPSVVISSKAKFGKGNFLAPGVIIEPDVVIEDYVIINTNASISHDSHLHHFSQISPGCNIAGNVTIGEGAFLGTGAVVIPGKVIGEYAVIGAGAVVINDIPPYCTAVGIPAKVIKQVKIAPRSLYAEQNH